jgi:16S rRNA (guanine527-N7)-methyltransferase
MDNASLISKFFPDLTSDQIKKYEELQELYQEWNSKINVISRKDIESLYERHVLHSLSIAKIITFKPGTKILDVGTGGGFPGIPLAIMFPEVSFHLVDSIGKKIRVVEEVSKTLDLKNVKATQTRAEDLPEKYDFVVSRAVTRIAPFWKWIQGKFSSKSFNALPNGLLYLKGGDLEEELTELKRPCEIFCLSEFFQKEFFATKKVIYVAR